MADIKKFLDSGGLAYFCKKFQDYPNNEILSTVINAIDATKVDKENGKVLSSNDFTNEDKDRLNSSLLYTEQTLTEEQQSQARTNIGAVAEAKWADAEAGRVAAENARVSAEEQRASAEMVRAQTWATLKSDAEAATSAASEAANAANTLTPVIDGLKGDLDELLKPCTLTGKNIYDASKVGDVDVSGSGTIRYGAKLELIAGVYTLSISEYPARTSFFRIIDNDGVYGEPIQITQLFHTFTLSNDGSLIIYSGKQSDYEALIDLMVEYGDKKTEYEPYYEWKESVALNSKFDNPLNDGENGQILVKTNNGSEWKDNVSSNASILKKHKMLETNTELYNVSHSYNRTLTVNDLTRAVVDGVINDIYTYSVPMMVNPNYPTDFVKQGTTRRLGYSCRFKCDGSRIEVMGYGGNSTYILISVNGVIVTEEMKEPTDNGVHYFIVDFGTSEEREIELFITGIFGGVFSDGSIYKTDNTGKLLFAFDGDSIVEGVSQVGVSSAVAYSWGARVCQKLNCNLYDAGIGGSGYIAEGNQGEPNMVDRFSDYIGQYQPDALIVSAGLNDSAKTKEELEVAIDTYWANVTTILTTNKIIMVSPFEPKATIEGGVETVCGVCKNIARKYHVPYIDIVHGKTYDSMGACISSFDSGIITSDNYSEFIGDDGTHPNKKGHYYIGEWLANEIYKLLVNDYGLYLSN